MNKKILPLLLLSSFTSMSAVEFYQYIPEQDKNRENILEYNNVSFLINEGKYELATRTLEKIAKRMSPKETIYENVLYQLGYVYMKTNEKNKAIEYFEKVGKIKSAKQSYITLLANWYLFQYTGEFTYLERNKTLYKIFKDYIVNEKEILVHINGDLLTNDFEAALDKYKRISKEKQNPEHLLYLYLLNNKKIEAKREIEKIRKAGKKNREIEKKLSVYNLYLNLQQTEIKEVKEEIRNIKKYAIEKPNFKLKYKVEENLLDREFLQGQLVNEVLSNLMKLNYIMNDIKYYLNLNYEKELEKVSTEKEHAILKRRIFAQDWLKNNIKKDLYLVYEEYTKKLDIDDLNFQESFNLGLLNMKMGRYIEAMPLFKRAFYLKPQIEYSSILLLIIDNSFKHNKTQRLKRLEKKQIINKIETSKDPYIKYLYEKLVLKHDKEALFYKNQIKNEYQIEITNVIEELRFTKNRGNLDNYDRFTKVLLSIISGGTQFEKIKMIQEYFLIHKEPILLENDPTFITDIKIKMAYISGVLKDKVLNYTLFDKPSYLRGIALIKVFEGFNLEGKELLEKLTLDYNIKDINTNQMLLLAHKKLGNTEKIETILSDKNITKDMYKLLLLSKIKRTFEDGDFDTLQTLLTNPQYLEHTLLVIEPDYLIEQLLNKKNIILKRKNELKNKK